MLFLYNLQNQLLQLRFYYC